MYVRIWHSQRNVRLLTRAIGARHRGGTGFEVLRRRFVCVAVSSDHGWFEDAGGWRSITLQPPVVPVKQQLAERR